MLVAAVRQFLRNAGITGQKLVIGVSGGPDSLALLYAVSYLSEELALTPTVAHFNHQLRASSRADALFVEQTAVALKLPFVGGNGDVAVLARKTRTGLEEAGRNARLNFFQTAVADTGSAAVAIAHTSDDQTETRLLHLIRGSGLVGLVGMSDDVMLPVVGGGSVRIVRPLLGVSRSEVEQYCQGCGLSPRIDSSNSDRAFARNRLRLDVVPSMRLLNPGVDVSLARLGQHAKETEDYLVEELNRRLPKLVAVTDGSWTIERGRWYELAHVLKRQLLRRATSELGLGSTVGADGIDRAIVLADRTDSGIGIDWGKGYRFEVLPDHLLITRGPSATTILVDRPLDLTSDQSTTSLSVPQSLARLKTHDERVAEPSELIVSRINSPCLDRQGDRWHADFDAVGLRAAGSAALRSRRPGDWLEPEGMIGRKKVQDLLVDARIPRNERNGVTIVDVGGNIIWVVGLRRDRRFLASPNSHHVLCFDVAVQPQY